MEDIDSIHFLPPPSRYRHLPPPLLHPLFPFLHPFHTLLKSEASGMGPGGTRLLLKSLSASEVIRRAHRKIEPTKVRRGPNTLGDQILQS